MDLISIIIPIYNCEKYLDECIKSIIAQTYFKIEIILVDDGSTDSSLEICRKYCKKDNRIKIISQKNGGVADARNTGLKHASGKYVLFVDADDYVVKDFVYKMYNTCLEDKADIVICGIYKVGKGKKLLVYNGEVTKDNVSFLSLCTEHIGGYVCNKMFSMHMLKELQLWFNLELQIGEDLLFVCRYYEHCNKVSYISEGLYFYRLNRCSATKQSIKDDKMFKKKASYLNAINSLEQQIEKTPIIVRGIGYRKVRISLWLLYQMIVSGFYDKSSGQEIRKLIIHNFIYFIKNQYAKKLECITAIIVGLLGTKFIYILGRIACVHLNIKFQKYVD